MKSPNQFDKVRTEKNILTNSKEAQTTPIYSKEISLSEKYDRLNNKENLKNSSNVNKTKSSNKSDFKYSNYNDKNTLDKNLVTSFNFNKLNSKDYQSKKDFITNLIKADLPHTSIFSEINIEENKVNKIDSLYDCLDILNKKLLSIKNHSISGDEVASVLLFIEEIFSNEDLKDYDLFNASASEDEVSNKIVQIESLIANINNELYLYIDKNLNKEKLLFGIIDDLILKITEISKNTSLLEKSNFHSPDKVDLRKILIPTLSLLLKDLASKSYRDDRKIFFMLSNYLLESMIKNKIEINSCSISVYLEVLAVKEYYDEINSLILKLKDYNSYYSFDLRISNQYSKLNNTKGLNNVCFGLLIRTLCKNNNIIEAVRWFEFAIKEKYVENEVIFNNLIDYYAKTRQINDMIKIYNKLKEINLSPSIVTYNSLIYGYINANDFNSAFSLFEEIKYNNTVKPDIYTYSTIIKGIKCLSSDDPLVDKLINLVEEIYNSDDLLKSKDVFLFNVLLDNCLYIRNDDICINLWEKIKSNENNNIIPDIITFNTFIKNFSSFELYDKAEEVYFFIENMQNNNKNKNNAIKPNDVTFNSMINVYTKNKNFIALWKIVDKMKELHIKYDNYTYSTIIKGLDYSEDLSFLQEKNLDINVNNDDSDEQFNFSESYERYSNIELAFILIRKVIKEGTPDEIIYNCLMDACLKSCLANKCLEVYDEMIKKHIYPSSISYGILIKAYGQLGKPEKSIELFEKEMIEKNIPYSEVTYGNIINICVKFNILDKAFCYIDELLNSNVKLNTVLCTTMIKACSKANNINSVFSIFEKMLNNKNIKPNRITINSILDACVKAKNSSKAEYIFNKMLELNIEPDTISYSTIIKAYLNEDRINKALEVFFNKSKENKYIPQISLFNTLLDGCIKSRKIRISREIYYRALRELNITPNLLTYSLMMKVFGLLNEFQESKNLFTKCIQNKSISIVTASCYMKTCFSNKKIKDAIDAWNVLDKLNIEKDEFSYKSAIKEFTKYDVVLATENVIKAINTDIVFESNFYIKMLSLIKIKNDKDLDAIQKLVLLLKNKNLISKDYSLNKNHIQEQFDEYNIKGNSNKNKNIGNLNDKYINHPQYSQHYKKMFMKNSNEKIPKDNIYRKKKDSIINLEENQNCLGYLSSLNSNSKYANQSIYNKKDNEEVDSCTNINYSENILNTDSNNINKIELLNSSIAVEKSYVDNDFFKDSVFVDKDDVFPSFEENKKLQLQIEKKPLAWRSNNNNNDEKAVNFNNKKINITNDFSSLNKSKLNFGKKICK